VDGVEISSPSHLLIKDFGAHHEKSGRPPAPRKLQKKASRPGVIQGRLEEMSMIGPDAVAGDGAEVMPVIVQHDGAQAKLYFASGHARMAKIGKVEGDDAVYKVVLWTAGEFEIDFNAANASTKTTTARRIHWIVDGGDAG